jgi:oligoribonuclease NrnB/cAMP/cGMP phosphodiesterase (DHH superfamily)
MICVYHNADLDGLCSAAIVNYWWKQRESSSDLVLLGADYKRTDEEWEKLFLEICDKGKHAKSLIMADFSMPMKWMFKLKEAFDDFTWLDHHKSAIEEAEKVGFYTCSILRIGTGACELTWEFFFQDVKPLPEGVELLSLYDVWKHEDYRVLPFQYGMRAEGDTSPENLKMWSRVFEDYEYGWMYATVSEGETIIRYEAIMNRKYAEAHAFETELWLNVYGKPINLRAICINRGMSGAKLFDGLYDEDKHDIMVLFSRKNNGNWTVSLYSTKDEVDCSVIAKEFGGGGHARAAGFIQRYFNFV